MIQGEVNVPIVPHASNALIVLLPPSTMNTLLTVSRVSNDNDDAVPVVSSIVLQYADRDCQLANSMLTLHYCDVLSSIFHPFY